MPTNVKMEVFVPDELFDTEALTRVINNELNETALAVKVDFGVTTRTWKHKPKFRVRKTNNGFGREISTDDEIYGYVNFGTKAHDITPKNSPMLSFQTGYKPKTLTRQILSRQGGASGPRVVAQKVRHPGTEPRDFDIEIAEKWAQELPVQMQRAIDAEVKK